METKLKSMFSFFLSVQKFLFFTFSETYFLKKAFFLILPLFLSGHAIAVNLTLKDLEWDYFKFDDGKILLRLPLKPEDANGKYIKLFEDKKINVNAGRFPVSKMFIRELEIRDVIFQKMKNKIIYKRERKKRNSNWVVSRLVTCYFKKLIKVSFITSSTKNVFDKPNEFNQRVQEDDAIFESVLASLFQTKGIDTTTLEIIRISERVRT